MNKEMFELLGEYKKLETDLYFKLIEENGMSLEQSEELVNKFTDLHERTLKIGKYLDEDLYVNKETYLTKKYNGLDSYLRVNIIYLYENGFALCETTSGLIELVPTEYLYELQSNEYFNLN